MKNEKHLQMILASTFILIVSLGLPSVHVFAQKTVTTPRLTPREIAQQTLPSTVLLVMSNNDTEEIKSGSGFFISEDTVVTNFHVIKETNQGYAKIYNQEKIYEISGVVGIDEKNDLALIKINGIKGKALKLNSDDSIAIGDEVFAVGNPKGLEGTFSQGIISSIRKTGKFYLLQITAPISSGSSGGAVLNDKGEVIGVAVGAIESGQSLNFAIPGSLLRSLISNQKPIKSLASNTTVAAYRPTPNRNIQKNRPDNLPALKPVPERKLKIQFMTSDLESEKLFGNIQSIKESTYIPEQQFDDWVLGEPVSASTKSYNVDGYEEFYEEVMYSERDLFAFMALSVMYPKGTNIELPFTTKILHFYDYSKGLMRQENFRKCGSCPAFEPVNKFLIRYQTEGKTRFSSDGKITWKELRSREKEGKTIVEQFDANGKLYRRKLTYKDKSGEVEEEWNRYKDQFELTSKTIRLEVQGKLKENHICVKKSDICWDSTTIRDKSTKLIHSVSKKFPSGLYSTKYDYEFDSVGNWTKQTESEQVTKFGRTYFEPIRVIVREISYY